MPWPDDNAPQYETVEPGGVHRPTDSGVDLPAARSTDELDEDARAVETTSPEARRGSRPRAAVGRHWRASTAAAATSPHRSASGLADRDARAPIA